MVTHDAWEMKLSPFIDGELPADEVAALEKHLGECGGCRVRVDQLRRISESIRGLDRVAMPEAMKRTLANGSATAARRSPMSRLPLALASAGAALILVVAVLAIRPDVATREPPLPAAERAPAPSPMATAEKGEARPDDRTRRSTAPQRQEIGDTASLREDQIERPPARKAAPPAAPAATDEVKEAAPQRADAEVSALDADEPDAAAAISLSASPPEPPVGSQPEASPVLEKSASISSPPRPSATRFVARLARNEAGEIALSPIEPLIDRPASDKDAAGRQGFMAGAAYRDEAAIPRSAFLVRLDPSGRIVSADPVGAKTAGETAIDTIRALLLSATIGGRAASDPQLVVVEVEIPPGL